MSIAATLIMVGYLLLVGYVVAAEVALHGWGGWFDWGLKWYEALVGLSVWVCVAACIYLLVSPGGTVLAGNALAFLCEPLAAFFRWLVAHV